MTRLQWELLQAKRRARERHDVAAVAAAQGKLEKLRDGARWEEEFDCQLNELGLHYRREYRFIEGRRFRFDFAFVLEKVAVEIDGAVHRIRNRFFADREKGQLAVIQGWKVLHLGPEQVRDGSGVKLLAQLLNVSGS